MAARGELPELDMCPDLRARLGRQLAELDLEIATLRSSREALARYVSDPVGHPT